MNTSHRPQRLASIIALAGLLALAGCNSTTKSSSLEQGATATESIQKASDGIIAARQQVNVTTAALRNLVSAKEDIPGHYKVAAKEMAKLEEAAAKIVSSADKMRAKGDAYLADWARQVAAIQNPELRDTAFARRAEVSADLQKIFQSYQTVKASYEPFQQNLADIKTVLSTDLSARGLEAIKPFVAKATDNAEPVKASLTQLAEDFKKVGVALAPAGTVQ